MKKIYLLLSIASLFLFATCTKNFEEINTNPNYPDIAPSSNVFAYVVQRTTGLFGSTEMTFPASYVGHISQGLYPDETRYIGESPSIWSSVYRTIMANLNFVIKEAEDEGNNNMLAASLVLKVYVMQMIVDAYGPVPYTEAGLGSEGLIQPKYDNEEDIYTDLFSLLETANGLFDKTSGKFIGDGDLLYGDNLDKWKKFGNSLHLRLAIRISNVDEAKASAEISKILTNPTTYPIFASNADNASLTYPGGDWDDPWYSAYATTSDAWMAKPLIDALVDLNDPRLEFYTDSLKNGTYEGIEVGASLTKLYSKPDANFIKNQEGTVYLMKYSEIEFIKAEAARRNFITSVPAKDAYEKAIKASCEEFGISSTAITNYLASAGVAWNGDLDQIYTQKWISLYRQSWEAWAEMRRTDVPALGPAANSNYSGHNRTPFRFPYPESEKTLNSANIPASVNENDIYWGYQVWWDTRTGVQ
ncbi:MAG: SusD/RagB family nutrient-binding outer membrane lipoprotein [Bacteroidales bacterium]|nr:SusD/RagB family nutrient-binding outer membrane lipoprotein [Bacteroidales bacterium]